MARFEVSNIGFIDWIDTDLIFIDVLTHTSLLYIIKILLYIKDQYHFNVAVHDAAGFDDIETTESTEMIKVLWKSN